MKKWKGVLAIILAASCLGGCSQFKAEHNAVKLKKDGSVQAAVIDTLDKSYYSRDELEKTVDDAVTAYNVSQEKAPIVVKKFSGEEDTIELYMDYAAAEDYQKFNNVTFYAGDLQGAYDSKYKFPDTLYSFLSSIFPFSIHSLSSLAVGVSRTISRSSNVTPSSSSFFFAF